MANVHLTMAVKCHLIDIIIASESAKFGQPEITLGVIPGILRGFESVEY